MPSPAFSIDNPHNHDVSPDVRSRLRKSSESTKNENVCVWGRGVRIVYVCVYVYVCVRVRP